MHVGAENLIRHERGDRHRLRSARLGRFRGVRGSSSRCRRKLGACLPASGRKRDVGPYLDRSVACHAGTVATRIVILGGGTGGTLAANRLRRVLDDAVEIVVVDQDDAHVYQPGLLFVPFGLAHLDEIVRPRARQLHDGIGYRRAGRRPRRPRRRAGVAR